MDTDAAALPAAPAENGAAPAGLLPEVEAYAFLLVVTFLVDRKRYEEVCSPLAMIALAVALFGMAADVRPIWAHRCLYSDKTFELASTWLALLRSTCAPNLGQEALVS